MAYRGRRSGQDEKKKPLPSSGLLTQNVRPVVLCKGLLSHLWSVKGCTLSSKAVTGMAEVLVTDGVCKCALVLKSLRDISTNGLFPGCVILCSLSWRRRKFTYCLRDRKFCTGIRRLLSSA